MKKILFLDFDGVLHPASGDSVPEFPKAPALAGVMQGYACEIVISSTWRLHYSLAELKEFLPVALAERVIGTTGEDPRSHFSRHDSILAWLNQADPVDWRALDDAKAEFRDTSHLIACSPQAGLEDAQALELRKWLEAAAPSDRDANMNFPPAPKWSPSPAVSSSWGREPATSSRPILSGSITTWPSPGTA
jgi:hypothetical protein